jgi:hypothetical protein
VCTKAVAVVRAVGADFFLDRWHVEIENASVISKRVTIVYTVTTFEISYYKPPEDGHQ